jgi:ornithine carbamoyltransferase
MTNPSGVATRPVRHFLDLWGMAPQTLHAMLEDAVARKRARRGWPQGRPDADRALDGRVVALIFEKPSTRTRISFDVGIRQLGGTTMVLSVNDMQLGRGETVEDTARVLSGFVDAVMIRALRHETVETFAQAATIPVINGLTDRSHPCQIMADMLTLKEHFGHLKGLKLAWLGDGNNVAASFIHASAVFGFDLTLATPAQFAPKRADLARAEAAGGRISLTQSVDEAVRDADVIVADTFVSMGDTDREARLKTLAPYAVTAEVMAKAASHAVFLHCLPAHRGEEVTAEVIDGPQSLVFAEAENRLHAQKSILAWCFGALR